MGALFAVFPPREDVAVGPAMGDMANSERRRSMVRYSSCSAERFESASDLALAEGLLVDGGADDDEAARRINLSRREVTSASVLSFPEEGVSDAPPSFSSSCQS